MFELPYSGAKARFKNGVKVGLSNLLGGICFTGVVVGKGVDQYGEYQEVKIDYPKDRKGQVKKCRLMDLAWLREIRK